MTPEELRAKNKKYYEAHREELRAYNKKYYETRQEELRASSKKYREAHPEECHTRDRKYRETHLEECRAHVRKYRKTHVEVTHAQSLKRRQADKNAVYSHYGHKCACPGCTETIPQFLSIDHINGGGRKHRKEIKGGNIYLWLIKNGYPPEFQILCFNCNHGRFLNGGICPHQTMQTASTED